MIPENTIENKQKFFAQYWGQKIVNWNNNLQIKLKLNVLINETDSLDLLELKPLSLITDDDAEGYLHFIGCHSFGERIQQAKIQIKEDCHNDIHMSDYLRSKGYALPWMGLSVETLVNYGWIKLKESE